ncbi:MAG TPA: SRPBCC domain-containing protein [Steroidobacteraceae bacterium]|nr:SRPBCC domain-containing protein [Steroidobacteraceae bacterium]
MSAELSNDASAGAGEPARTLAQSERALHLQRIVNAPGSAVWQAWATADGLKSFLAPEANVEPKIGGAYELFFNPADERMSTKDCKLLSYLPGEMISFQWSLPGDVFPELPKAATWVVVQLRPQGASRTEVRVTQLGWGTGPVWDRAYAHMQIGWEMAVTMLEQRFERGPIDWEAQRRMWQEARRQAAQPSDPGAS